MEIDASPSAPQTDNGDALDTDDESRPPPDSALLARLVIAPGPLRQRLSHRYRPLWGSICRIAFLAYVAASDAQDTLRKLDALRPILQAPGIALRRRRGGTQRHHQQMLL